MEKRPEIQTESFKLFGPNDWRNWSNLQNMSISELISKLRYTFIQRDFNVVEEILVSREAMFKTEIKEKNKQIELLENKFQMERSDKVNVEMELKRVKEERYKNELVKNGGVVKGKLGSETCIDEAVKKRRIVDFEDEKVEEKRRADEQRLKDGEGGSGKRFEEGSRIWKGKIYVRRNNIQVAEDHIPPLSQVSESSKSQQTHTGKRFEEGSRIWKGKTYSRRNSVQVAEDHIPPLSQVSDLSESQPTQKDNRQKSSQGAVQKKPSNKTD